MLNADATSKTGDTQSLEVAWSTAMITARPRYRDPLLASSKA